MAITFYFIDEPSSYSLLETSNRKKNVVKKTFGNIAYGHLSEILHRRKIVIDVTNKNKRIPFKSNNNQLFLLRKKDKIHWQTI